jgi:hypothetical protein
MSPHSCSPNRTLWSEMLHFQSQRFSRSFISLRPKLRSSSTNWKENILSPSTEPHPDGWPTYSGVRPAFPSGSLTTSRFPSLRSQKERCFVSRALLNLSLRVRVRKLPMISPVGPVWRGLLISRAFYYIPLGVPNKQGLMIKTKSQLSLEFVCK